MTTVPLDQIEALFGITFTDHERMLLTTSKALLSTREQQASYILAMGLQTCQCPACPYLLCQRSASIEPFDPASSAPDDAYACPNCKAALTWHLGMIGGGQWFTLTYPGQVADAAALADAADLCSVEIDGRPWADGDPSATGWEAEVERALTAQPGLTLSGIAASTGASPATISRALDWLKRHGRVDELPAATPGGHFTYRLR